MRVRDRERRRTTLGSAALAAGLVALGWLGLASGQVVVGSQLPVAAPAEAEQPTATSSPDPAPPPAPTVTVVPTDPALAAAFAEQGESLRGEYALAWLDADGLHVLGWPPAETAWSTIKVPLAIAALERSGGIAGPEIDEVDELVHEAVIQSDNGAALALWSSLGSPEEAAAAVDEVLDAYGSGETRTESTIVQPPYSPFGQTTWGIIGQARFAAAISCAPETSAAGRVHARMAGVVPNQRWGIGGLEDAHLKGGWGPEPGGAYVLRQLGVATVDDERYALALSARAYDGTHAQAAADMSAIVRWWAETVVPGTAGYGC